MSETKELQAVYETGSYKVLLGKHKIDDDIGTNKNPYFGFMFKVVGLIDAITGEVTPTEKQYERDSIIWLTEKSKKYFPRTFQALGFGDGTLENFDFPKLDPTNPSGHSFDGVEATMYCKVLPVDSAGYTGTQEEWSVALGGGGSDFLDERYSKSNSAVVDKLSALFGGPPAAPPVTVPADGAPDDGVPF